MINIELKFINEKIHIQKELIDVLNGIQNHFRFFCEVINDNMISRNTIVNWVSFYEKHKNEENTIYVMKNGFSDNWFSHNENNIALISYYNWDELFAPPGVMDYLIYQISLALVSFSARINENKILEMSHKKSCGCLLDACGNKQDVILGMKVGAICKNCESNLKYYRLGNDKLEAIKSLLNYVRSVFIDFTPIDYKGIFVVMRFKENEAIYEKGIVEAARELDLNCTKADLNILDQGILNNVIENIKRNKFIVVILENNPNVYFELGYAMALKKEIIILKSTKNEDRIASDISNLIYIEYDNEYDLKEKLKRYFDNYI